MAALDKAAHPGGLFSGGAPVLVLVLVLDNPCAEQLGARPGTALRSWLFSAR